MVPEGQDELTLASEDAAEKVWMPSVDITNRIVTRFDCILFLVTIVRDGKVTKVERTLAVIKNKFML